MNTIIGFLVDLLKLVPLVLVFFIPALPGVVIWKERSGSYRIKAGLWFVIGFGIIVAVRLMLRSTSALQITEAIALSLVELAFAIALAYVTVYKLAD